MINAQSTCPHRGFLGYTKVRIHGKKTHDFSGRKKSHGSLDLFLFPGPWWRSFFMWQYMMVDDESRKWQVWHDFVKRGSFLEKENTHTARQQNPSYLDLHQQWLPNNTKTKKNVWKKEPHKTGHPQTTKQNTKNPGCFSWRFFRVQGFPFLPAASSSGWMRSCGELAVLGTQHETVGCGNSYQVHTWKCNSWDGSAVGHVLFHYIIYIHMFSCVYICVSIYREA